MRLVTQPTVNPLYNGSLDTMQIALRQPTGVFDCIRKTMKWEGVRGFYKGSPITPPINQSMTTGVASPLAGQMLFQAIKFMAYGQSINLVKKVRGVEKMGPLDFIIAGGIAQSIGVLPVELI